jgi:glycosyltransferase involved in cell wall biosynthesis
MACGLPVVATAVGGIPEMIGTGDEAGGMLVPPLDPSLLAGAISQLAANPSACARLGHAALRRAANFSFEAEWAAYQRLYRGTG